MKDTENALILDPRTHNRYTLRKVKLEAEGIVKVDGRHETC